MREALKLALEALEQWNTPLYKRGTAITAIREALAQPEQEPFEYWNAVEGWVKIEEVREHFDSVGCGTIYKTSGEDRVPLYTTQPKRQPLTDEQIKEISDKIERSDFFDCVVPFARAIEAAHDIKENT